MCLVPIFFLLILLSIYFSLKVNLLLFQLGISLYWKLATGHPDYFLAKNLFKFCQCPGTLYGVEFKGDRLVHMVEGIL